MDLYTDKVINSFHDDYDFLSNFYPCKVRCFDHFYQSVEHAYQASKTTNLVERQLFRNSNLTAGQAKKLGRTITIRENWEEKKYKFMKELVEYKFHTNEELKQKLIATGDAELIEGNWWGDTYWGVCNGIGHNHLGNLLMRIRDDVQDDNCLFIPGSHEITF